MPMIAKKIDHEKEVSISDRLNVLEQRIVNLDAKFTGQIAGYRDKHLLTNDRIDEVLDIIKILERKVMSDG